MVPVRRRIEVLAFGEAISSMPLLSTDRGRVREEASQRGGKFDCLHAWCSGGCVMTLFWAGFGRWHVCLSKIARPTRGVVWRMHFDFLFRSFFMLFEVSLKIKDLDELVESFRHSGFSAARRSS